MVNTVTQRTLQGGGSDKRIIRLINIASDGSEESNLIIYDNSTFCNNVAKGNLIAVRASGSDCVLSLSWDQTTDSPAISLNPAQTQHLCLEHIGGIPNPAAAGATGDLFLSTASLDAGDAVTLIIEVLQN